MALFAHILIVLLIKSFKSIISHAFFYSMGTNYDLSDITCTAFIENTQGNPQKIKIRNPDEVTVNRKDSKSRPPNPNPTPTSPHPKRSLAVILAFLSCRAFEKSGFLLSYKIITIRILQ